MGPIHRIAWCLASLMLVLTACGGQESSTGGGGSGGGTSATVDELLEDSFGEVPPIPVAADGRAGRMFERAKEAFHASAGKYSEPPSRESLESIGDATVEYLSGQMPPTENAEVRDRIRGIVDRLLAVRPPDSDLEFSFVVLESDTVNAFMSPGGRGIVLTELARMLTDDSELAYVIGHEIGHGQLGHLRDKIHAAKLGREIGERIEGAAGGRAGTDRAPEYFQKVVQKVLTSAFDQDQEYEADRFGLALAIAAGFDAQGGIRALRAISGGGGSSLGGGLRRIYYDIVGTHPPAPDRIAYLERLLEARRASR